MDDTEATSLEQIRAFLAGSGEVRFAGQRREEVYGWVEKTLVRLEYASLDKPGKGLVRRYLSRMTGLSRAQVTRLIALQRAHRAGESGRLPADQVRHALHRCRRAPAGLRRQGARELKRTGHATHPGTGIQRLRASSLRAAGGDLGGAPLPAAQQLRPTGNATPAINPRGRRRFPSASGANRSRSGAPGFLRIDTVHQGDQEGRKGLYHINAVDEVTQWEIVAATPQISELWLLPVLEAMLRAVSLRDPRIPFRQRQRVHQLPSGRAAGQAAHRTDQVTRASLRRQRSGGGQERRGDPQAHRLRTTSMRNTPRPSINSTGST